MPEEWMWLLEIAIGIVLIFLLSLAFKKIVNIIRKRAMKKDGFWRKKIHKIIHIPIQVAVWGFGLAYLIDVICTHYGIDEVSKFVRPLKGAFIVACISWIVLRWVKEFFIHLAQKSEKLGISAGTIYALSKLASFVISILTLLIILQVFGFGVAPLLTFGGIGIAGLAFAAKDIMANFFGGTMLHFTRTFSIGDQVMIPSRDDFRGIIKEIGWYTTVIEDYYRRPVYFPNAIFSTVQVINESRRTHRRLKETVTLTYEDFPNIEKIIEEMKEKIGAHPEVDEKESFSITLDKFGIHGLEIYIYLLVYKMSYVKFMRIKQEIFLIIEEIIRKYGAEFCYPTTNVNLRQLPPK
ncbi:MAG: Low conductance mechanosensitive channel YnaI [Chlamydiae bacterium]|nr:Low conductance mechanosensitive channel YnaI [Chlamydiota bacterium]